MAGVKTEQIVTGSRSRDSAWHAAVILPSLLMVAALTSGCGSGSTSSSGTSTTPVTLNISVPAQTASTTAARTSLWAKVVGWYLGIGEAWAATINDIASISVTVSAPDISPPQTTTVPVSNLTSGQLITLQLNIKPGTGRTFTVSALNAAGSILFSGTQSGVNLSARQPATVTLVLAAVPNRFDTTGSMAFARQAHSATLLPTGKVLVAGGFGSVGSVPEVLNSTELYDPVTGTWTPTGIMTFTRDRGNATLLPNGKVLVVGGQSATGALASAELFDVSAGTWSLTGSLATARTFATVTLLPNGQVLVAGGFTQVGQAMIVFASSELYSPALPGSPGVWSSTGSMAVPRALPAVTSLPNGLTLAAGGSTAGLSSPAPTANVELFNPDTGTWTATGPLQTARIVGNATLLPNGLVLVAGGMANNTASALTSTELYNPGTGTWSPTGAMGTARLNVNATVLLPNGKVLIAGGSVGTTGAQGLTSAELYDPVTGTWGPTGAMTTARGFQPAVLLPNGKVLTAGGTNAVGTVLASAELYDPATGTWLATGSMATPRQFHTASLLPNGKGLVAGGIDAGGNAIASAELYDPLSGLWTGTGSMNAARGSHGAVRLSSGKILVVSGSTSFAGDSVTTSAEIYFPQSGVWNLTGSLAQGRSTILHAAALLWTGQVLVTGGSASNSALSSAELFSSSIP